MPKCNYHHRPNGLYLEDEIFPLQIPLGAGTGSESHSVHTIITPAPKAGIQADWQTATIRRPKSSTIIRLLHQRWRHHGIEPRRGQPLVAYMLQIFKLT